PDPSTKATLRKLATDTLITMTCLYINKLTRIELTNNGFHTQYGQQRKIPVLTPLLILAGYNVHYQFFK
ncbi:hypothetical protein, partial [Escherichia coli]|uniref:hypothetical protein n=1 Tax=Escherichia coli TaxID=562 RepID=UPI00081BDF5F